jgi:hypothetical protein
VVRGSSPNDARGRWYDTNLVRWNSGVLEPIGGWERATPTPLPYRVRNLSVWRDNEMQRYILAASMSKVHVEYGEGFLDVTPSDLVAAEPTAYAFGFGVNDFGEEDFGDARSTPSVNIEAFPAFWTFSNWGEDMVGVSSVDGRLLTYDVTNREDPFAPVAGAPIGNASVLVTAERHVALLQVGNNPRRVGWCSREDMTDWDFASITNTAGFLDLETSTPLVKGVRCRGGNLIFSGSEVFMMQYLGLPYVYGFPPIGQTRLVHPDTVVTDNGNVFWWAADGFKMFDGASIKALECPVWDYVIGRANSAGVRTVAHGSALGSKPEIWWFYPSGDTSTCDSYVMTNYEEGWWAIGKLGRSAMVAAQADRFPYMAGEDNHIYRHESGWGGAEVLREVWAETSALAFGNGDRAMEVRQALIANGFGFDSLQMRVYSNRTPEGAERGFGPYKIRPDGYMDTRASGRDLRLRFENTKNADWSVGEVRLDIAPGAGR